MNEDIFDSHCWDLGDENASERIGDRSIYTDQGEGGFEGVIVVEFDLEMFLEFGLVPGMVFSWIMPREINRGNIGDGFCINPYNLFDVRIEIRNILSDFLLFYGPAQPATAG